MILCKVDSLGYFIDSFELPITSSIPPDCHLARPPDMEDGKHYLYRGGSDPWIEKTERFYAPVTQPVDNAIYRVTKSDFQRRVPALARIKINGLRKKIANLPEEAYDWDPEEHISEEYPNGQPNPYILLLNAEDVLQAFEQPSEYIELTHIETRQGLEFLMFLDILTQDDIESILRKSGDDIIRIEV